MNLKMIAEYSGLARQKLYEILSAHDEVFDRLFQTLSNYTTIRELLVHSIGAEERWVSRLEGQPLPSRYEARAPATLAEIWQDWAQLRTRTLALVENLDPEGLRQTLHVVLPQWGQETDYTYEEILLHVFLHEIHHRAQISMLLQHFGIDPPNFDFVLLIR
jgi:uncharacterized damage-inducible protein DinB